MQTRAEGSALVFLEAGWRTFARQFNLRRGDSLCCRFDGEETLSIRAFDSDVNRLEPCWESSSDSDSGGSGDTRSSASGGGPSGLGITSSRSFNSSSGGGGDSYSSFEQDAEDVKPSIKRARR